MSLSSQVIERVAASRRVILTVVVSLAALTCFGGSAAAQNRSGSYLSREGELVITDKGRSRPLEFRLTVGNSRGTCTGEAEGHARWVSPTRAEFSDEFCKLTFEFVGGRVRVSEGPNCGYHGVACGFAGTYRRPRGR